MTRTALKKIGACIALFAFALVGCLAIDASVAATSPDVDGADISSDAQKMNTESLAQLIEDERTTTLDLANECFGQSFETELPAAFVAEALDPSTFDEAYSAGPYISLTYNGPSSEARIHCKEELEGKGWSALGEDDQLLISYVKEEGTLRWLSLQFLSLGKKTTVLVKPIQN